MERRNVSVEAHPDVLDVVNNDVYIGKLLVGWFFVGAVKRNQRESGFVVGTVSDVLSGIGIASKTVFRGKNLYYIEFQWK